MIVKGVDRDAIDRALAHANSIFDGNVIYNREPEPLNNRNDRWRVTLRVRDSKGPGHRLGFGRAWGLKPRRLVSACWHVHGVFFDSILRQGGTIQTGQQTIDSFGDNWEDRDVGSMMYPQYFSDLCDCDADLADRAYSNEGGRLVDDPIIEMLEDLAGDSGQDETWTCPHDGHTDWHALFLDDDGMSYIYHVDNAGFKSYDEYPNVGRAMAAWDELVNMLDDFYGGEE